MKRKPFHIAPIFLVLFLDNFGLSVVFILFAPLMLDPAYGFLDASTSLPMRNFLLSLLYGSFSLSQFIASPLLGELADGYGRKKSLIYSIYGLTLGFLLCGLAIEWSSYLGLLFGRLFTGFFAGNVSICLAAISDRARDSHHRSQLFGLVAFFFGTSFILGLLAGGILSDHSLSGYFTPALPFWIAGMLSVIGAFVISYFFRETHVQKKRVSISLGSAFRHIVKIFELDRVKKVYITYFFWSVTWMGCIQQFGAPILLEHFKAPQIEATLFLVYLGLSWSMGGLVINRYLSKKHNSYPLALISIVGMVICVAFASIAPLSIFKLLIYLTAIFASITMSHLLNLISTNTSEDEQGAALGISRSVLSLSTLLSPLLGMVVAILHLFVLIPLGAFLAFISLVVLMSWKKDQK